MTTGVMRRFWTREHLPSRRAPIIKVTFPFTTSQKARFGCRFVSSTGANSTRKGARNARARLRAIAASGAVVFGLVIHQRVGQSARCDTPSDNLKRDHSPTMISMGEVAAHRLANDVWVVIDGQVIDPAAADSVTNFHDHHPGGSKVILANGGRDVTALFHAIHPAGVLQNNLGPECFKGSVDPEQAASVARAIHTEKERVAAVRQNLPPVETQLSLDDLETTAQAVMTTAGMDYYAASALDGYTKQDNRQAFRKCRLLPQVLKDVGSVDPTATIFGVTTPLPIYISPAANALLGHPEGEYNLTRAAAKTGIVQGVSAASAYSLRALMDERDKLNEELNVKMGMVYQIYMRSDRKKALEYIQEAVDGGVQALLLTVDSAVIGTRQTSDKLQGTRMDAEPGIRFGPFVDRPAAKDPTLNWNDLEQIKKVAGNVPIYLKGVCTIDDVRRAKEHDLAGCILSNHGGRQLDQSRTGYDSLRAIYQEDPNLCREIELYIDGGISRGTDVLQAIAFGAKGVGLGRAFLYAQAAYGEQGVVRAVRILESEIITAMRLLGVNKLDDMTPKYLECLQELWK